jgi:branched-chain amino acid transport system permease protein
VSDIAAGESARRAGSVRSQLAALLRSDRFIAGTGWLTLGIAALVLVLINSVFWLYVGGLVIIYAISALGLDWIQGRAGQVSIGNAAFMAIGAFFGAVGYTKGLPLIPSLLLAAVAGAAVGAVVGLPALRLTGLYLALATLALQFIVSSLSLYYESKSGQISGIGITSTKIGSLSFRPGRSFFLALLVVLVLVVIAYRALFRRAPGRAWLAIKESEMAASVMGIYPTRWKVSAFVWSSAIVAMSGGLLAFYTGRVESESFPLDLAILFVAIVIVGGLGSIGGVIAGAVLIGATPYILSTVSSSLPSGFPLHDWLQANIYYINSGLYGILLLVFLLFQPLGIAGAMNTLRYKAIDLLDGTESSRAGRAQTKREGVTGERTARERPVERARTPGSRGPMLQVENLNVYRSGACAVDGIDLEVGAGEVVAIVGRNGAGKTSTLRGISGFFVTERSRVTGAVVFDGKDIRGLSPMQTAKLGVALVPERAKVFPNLSVGEHFRLARAAKSDIDSSLELFPQLRARLGSEAGLLSGGERQMLAMAVAFCMKPKLLLVDELSLGLSPVAIKAVIEALKRFKESTKVSILLVEQNVSAAMELADRIYVLEAGQVEVSGSTSELSDETLISATLGGA